MVFKFWCFVLPCYLFATPGYQEPWGKETDLHVPLPISHKEVHLSMAAHAMKGLIWFHQNIISPVDGPRSHFKPSSSNYMRQAIDKYGFVKGYLMGCDRLVRENSDRWIYRTTLIENKIWKVDPPP